MPTALITGLRFEFDDEGPADGAVCLLLHGFPQDRTSWDGIAAVLVDSGFRVIRLDQRGYSPGARPTRIEDYRLALLVDDVIGLLDHLGIPAAHVIGHDWGGVVAWGLASMAPERLLTLTVLSTPHPAALSSSMLTSTQALRSWYMGVFQIPVLSERLLAPGGRFWAGIMRGLPRTSKERYTSRARDPLALSAMLAWYRALPRDLASPSVRWGPIDVPTLYAWGADDPALGAAAARRTSRHVRGPYTFVVLPGEGHWLPERAAARVIEHLLPHLRREE